jgi:hypothetical protein
MEIPIGVANSVSSNFSYDPIDTIQYANQSEFDIIQIYLNRELLATKNSTAKDLGLQLSQGKFKNIYLHADGYLNKEFLLGDYYVALQDFINSDQEYGVIIHFDENCELEDVLKIVEKLSKQKFKIYLENYFQSSGKANAEKNIRKYMALFTLANNFSVCLHPVIDIPRFFHERLELGSDSALQWCYQVFNFFGNKGIQLLLHLIDATTSTQRRNQYCPIGEGYIPYQKLFDFMIKTSTPIEGIILEFEDKIAPLKSREYLNTILSH